MQQDNDQPLGQQFMQNPYQYFQSFVRNMNNQVFLSQYQLSHLYSLLLLKKQSPWDQLRPNSETLKTQIQGLVNSKVIEVKKMLESLSQIYENKLKKNTFTQIQRLMSILKAKNKSIFIQKDYHFNEGVSKIKAEGRMVKSLITQESKIDSNDGQIGMEIKSNQNTAKLLQKQQHQQQGMNMNDFSCQTQQSHLLQSQKNRQQSSMQQQHKHHQHRHQSEHKNQSQHQHQQQCQSPLHQSNVNNNSNNNNNDQREVLSLFYGIANIPNLSSLALGNCLQYSAAQRYIKFQMSKNYIMTIKNDDQLSYDRTSLLRNVSPDLFTHHIFPYLTAVELFKSRSVCRQWMENVKEAWHSTFKREMFVQLMACEFCKEIEFYYKLIQLRNPFFQKVSLLMHALIEIIQWQRVTESVNNNTLAPQLKKVLIILLKLIGQPIAITPNLNAITQQLWQQHKQKTLQLKPRLSHFLNNIQSSNLSILELMKIKVQLLDDPFMRVQELNSEDKTPLLLVIFIKQLTLQQILKNHVYFSQQYLMNTKRRLDNISSKMPQQKGFLQGVYKIILLRSFGNNSKTQQQQDKQQRSQMPNFSSILSSIFDSNGQSEDKPDFVLKSKSSLTNIYMDKATKLDIIVSTVKKMGGLQERDNNDSRKVQQEQQQQRRQQQDDQGLAGDSHDRMQQKKQTTHIINEHNQMIGQTAVKSSLQTVNIYNINFGQQQKPSQDKSSSTAQINKSNNISEKNDQTL